MSRPTAGTPASRTALTRIPSGPEARVGLDKDPAPRGAHLRHQRVLDIEVAAGAILDHPPQAGSLLDLRELSQLLAPDEDLLRGHRVRLTLSLAWNPHLQRGTLEPLLRKLRERAVVV